MEIKIDFSNKKIEVLSQIEIGELIKNLKRMFPKDWKEFKIVQSCYPVYVNQWPWWYYNPPVVNVPTVFTDITSLPIVTTDTAGDGTLRISAN